MGLSEFYIIEGSLIILLGTFYLIKPFLNYDKFLKSYDDLFTEFNEYDKLITDRAFQLSAHKSNEINFRPNMKNIKDISIEADISNLASNRLQKSTETTNYLNGQFRKQVINHAKLGFVIIMIGVFMEIFGILIKNQL